MQMTNKLSIFSSQTLLLCLAAGVFCLLAAKPAQAQYKWKDANGSWVFSDQPPPTTAKTTQLSGPKSAIPVAAASATSPSVSPSPTSSVPKPSNTEGNRADKEMATRRAELDKQAAAKEKLELQKKNEQACQSTRENIDVLQSGRRVRSGEPGADRAFLAEDEKQKKLEQAQKDFATHCKS